MNQSTENEECFHKRCTEKTILSIYAVLHKHKWTNVHKDNHNRNHQVIHLVWKAEMRWNNTRIRSYGTRNAPKRSTQVANNSNRRNINMQNESNRIDLVLFWQRPRVLTATAFVSGWMMTTTRHLAANNQMTVSSDDHQAALSPTSQRLSSSARRRDASKQQPLGPTGWPVTDKCNILC